MKNWYHQDVNTDLYKKNTLKLLGHLDTRLRQEVGYRAAIKANVLNY